MQPLSSRAIAALALLARADAFASVPTGVSQCKVLEGQEYSNQQLEGINEGDNFADTIGFNGDGNIIAIGAHMKNTGVGYVLVRDLDGKVDKATIHSPIDTFGDKFGDALAVSRAGNVIAVGAKQSGKSLPGDGGTGCDLGHIASRFASVSMRCALLTSEIQTLGSSKCSRRPRLPSWGTFLRGRSCTARSTATTSATPSH